MLVFMSHTIIHPPYNIVRCGFSVVIWCVSDDKLFYAAWKCHCPIKVCICMAVILLLLVHVLSVC